MSPKKCMLLMSMVLWGWVVMGAQETELDMLLEMSLEDLMNMKVVTASKSEQRSSDAPATIYTITEGQIKNRGYQSLMDVIKDLPDFIVHVNCNTEGQDLTVIRGLEGLEKMIILLDGAKISGSCNEGMPIFENYPIHFAKQIEVVVGPASALYGADAVSGVINIITKSPEEMERPIFVSVNGGMYNTVNTSLYYGKKFNESAGLLVAGQYFYDGQPDLSEFYKDEFAGIDSLKSGTFNTNWGNMTPKAPVDPDYNIPKFAWSVYSKLTFNDFSVSVFKNRSRVPSATSYTPNNAVYNEDVFWEHSITMATAVHQKTIGAFSHTATLTYSSFDILPTSNYRNIYVSMEPGYKYGTSSMSKIEEQLIWSVNEKLNLTGGVSFEKFFAIPRSNDLQDKVDEEKGIVAKLLGTDLDADFYTSKYNNIGSYLQAQYKASKQLAITLGTRFDYNSRYHSTFNPRLGVVYAPTSKTNIKLLYGSAFLAPAPSAAFMHYGSFYSNDTGKTYYSYYVWVPSPNLDPMKSQNGEISIQQYLGGELSVTAGAWYTRLTDLLAATNAVEYWNEADQVYYYKGRTVYAMQRYRNAGVEKLYGGTLKLDYLKKFGQSSRLSAFVAMSYTTGEVDALDNGDYVDVAYIVPMAVKAGAELMLNKLIINPQLTFLGKQRSLEMETNEGATQRKTIDGFALLNLHLRYAVTPCIGVFAKVSNALDSRYTCVNYYAGAGSPEIPGGTPQNPMRVAVGIDLNL